MDFVYKFDKNLIVRLTIGQKLIAVIFLSLFLAFIFDIFPKKLKFKLSGLFILFGIILGLNFIENRWSRGESFLVKQAIVKWIKKPTAARFVDQYDRSYFGWISHSGKIQMRYFDHKQRKFSTIHTVDDLYLEFKIEAIDDHNSPSLLVLPNGQILIFYVVHDIDNSFFMKTSQKLEDIDLWSERINLVDQKKSDFYNYPQPKRLANGRFLFFSAKGLFIIQKNIINILTIMDKLGVSLYPLLILDK